MSEIRTIALSRGLVATVDAADFDWLSQWKWSALRTVKGGTERFYACRVQVVDGKQKMFLMHRVIMEPGAGLVVDHRDRNSLNNTRLNLRVCSQAKNCLNIASHKDSVSSFKGVWWHKQNGRWCADFRGKYIGSFNSQEEAAAAYDRAALSHDPAFALLNFECEAA